MSTITGMKQGSYLLNRKGELIEVLLHVPSTTYVGRGIIELAPTDGEFLYTSKLITEEEYKSIVLHSFIAYARSQDIESYTLIDVAAFNSYAELRYAPSGRSYAMSMLKGGSIEMLEGIAAERYPDFEALNQKWYPYLTNQYVKVSRFGNTVEFRISSTDHFDWNEVIIDDVILNEDYGLERCKFSVLMETGKVYRPYFLNATLNDVLREDSIVMGAQKVRRKVINGAVVYEVI